ncbi:hypothetical protein EDI_026210 [Entamoeba dispar SAW760]|uniref:Uncharacterized protein n=1 Tax=Entamoeba dispar (strain ATCC PRA-260 / SAW760) TaxID=370354 RepID=B0EKR4_ENTDS|nr:uncharacterized protein EDI_026210 [Entamoeba dispar SAW760]EDR24887.1 hypothetical protein EDI_026210 [Entamoeba dispar SAW760]|eukprot:EDR24887.1 hypothetical protein EDI_026210 [Entamoeba dispar SAW760]
MFFFSLYLFLLFNYIQLILCPASLFISINRSVLFFLFITYFFKILSRNKYNHYQQNNSHNHFNNNYHIYKYHSTFSINHNYNKKKSNYYDHKYHNLGKIFNQYY